MTPWLTKLVHASNGRPFSPDELERIVQYVEFLPDALAAVKKLDDHQKWLVRHLSEWVAPKAQGWGLPKDPFTTDFAAFLAAVGQALLCDDITLLDATVVGPCESLAVALEIPAAEFAGLFDEAWRVLTPRLDPTAEQMLRPFFGRVSSALRGESAPSAPAPVNFPVLAAQLVEV